MEGGPINGSPFHAGIHSVHRNGKESETVLRFPDFLDFIQIVPSSYI